MMCETAFLALKKRKHKSHLHLLYFDQGQRSVMLEIRANQIEKADSGPNKASDRGFRSQLVVQLHITT